MPIDIDSLPNVRVDFTARGPGLQTGMVEIERLVAEKRSGYMLLSVIVDAGTIPVVMSRDDLYIVGFRSSTGWWHFSDAKWPFSGDASSLGHDGQYGSLGGLTDRLTKDSAVASLGHLLNGAKRSNWNKALRNLLVLVAECARLIPVRMRVLGLLNGVVHTLDLSEVERYIKNWSKASKGTDMSVEVSPTHRVGHKDPTIIKR